MHLDELLLKSQGRFLRFCFLRELGAFLGHSRKDLKDLGRTSEGPQKDLPRSFWSFQGPSSESASPKLSNFFSKLIFKIYNIKK